MKCFESKAAEPTYKTKFISEKIAVNLSKFLGFIAFKENVNNFKQISIYF